jgi:Zn finger protein HypA/HybF involved in hydrogenase expression
MTIRDYIKRRVRLTWVLFIVLLLTTLIAAALVSTFLIKLDMNLTVSIVLPLAVAFTFWRLMHIKCPRCHENVGLGAAMEQTDHCPHCEASFDQPVTPADGASPNTAAKPLTIRKYVHQRATQVQIFLMLAIVLVGIAVMTRFSVSTWAAILLGLIATAAGMLVAVAVAASTRCPRCLSPLGRAGASLMRKKPESNCPTCGISFDEPILRKME